VIPAWFDFGVLTVVTVLLLALAVHRGMRLADPGGASRTALVLFLAPTLAFGWAFACEARHQWTQARATAVTRELTGNPSATSVCQRYAPDLLDMSGYAGHVMSDTPNVAHLRRTTCNDLFSWLTSDMVDPTREQIIAVHVVVHEAMHVAGEFSEPTAECWAMQHDAEAAEFLGAGPEDARALAEAYYTQIYPTMSADYRSEGCRPDGDLDLSPGDGRFP
jgi:hypothetical protein